MKPNHIYTTDIYYAACFGTILTVQKKTIKNEGLVELLATKGGENHREPVSWQKK